MNPTGRMSSRKTACAFAKAILLTMVGLLFVRPIEATEQFKGRIAWSADGNHNDPDDWIASPLALAIFAEAGLKDRVVHVEYNSILPLTDPEWEKIHTESVLGAAERFGYDRSRFFDCRKDLEGATASLVRAINESTADNRLCLVIAGPMEVPFRAIQRADASHLPFVTCVSHSRWNDGFASTYKFTVNKRSVIETGVPWVQIADQNRLLSFGKYGRPATPEEFAPYFWMRDSQDARVKWLWERMVVSTRPDPSDAGMAWFVVSGDETCDPAKLKTLLETHQLPITPARNQAKLEAENFRVLDGFKVEDRKEKQASHQLAVKSSNASTCKMTTTFTPLFPLSAVRCDVTVRWDALNSKSARLAVAVNGTPRGEAWGSLGNETGWMSHVVHGVDLREGDEISLTAVGGPVRVDYVEVSPSPQASAGNKTLRVALCQVAVAGSIEENRDSILKGIDEGADRKARVAVFPEGTLAGKGDADQAVVEQAVAAIREAARRRGISVIFGAGTWLPSISKVTNWMLVIGPDGRDVMRYEKLFQNHRATMPPVFEIDGVKCGAAICADRWLRGVTELPIMQGAQVHFEISNNYATEWVEPYQWYWNAPFARRNSIWTLFVNSANRKSGVENPDDTLKHGHTVAISPAGSVQASAKDDTPEIIVADLEISQADRAEAIARRSQPVMKEFWEAGLACLSKEPAGATASAKRRMGEVEVTLAASKTVDDLEQIQKDIRAAADQRADLIAFPARAVVETQLKMIREAAGESRITVVIGATHQEGDRFLESAFVFSPGGGLVTRYDQLSAPSPCAPGMNPESMWFDVKGVPACVTIGCDAEWTELSELAVIAGARVRVHLDHDVDPSAAARLRRLQDNVNLASFMTFTATANVLEATIWDDTSSEDERRAGKVSESVFGNGVKVHSAFSADLVSQTDDRNGMVVAQRRFAIGNPFHPRRTSSLNPQMTPWYESGRKLIRAEP
jgi:predicted amidohydrolase